MSKDIILDAAIMLATHSGFRNVTRKAIAEKAQVGTGTVSYHFGSMARLHTAIIRAGVKRELLVIVAQGLVDKHRDALAAPAALRIKAAKLLAA